MPEASWPDGLSSDAVRDGIFPDVEADLGRGRFWRRRRRVQDLHNALEDIHDGGLVDVQTDLEFLFQQAS